MGCFIFLALFYSGGCRLDQKQKNKNKNVAYLAVVLCGIYKMYKNNFVRLHPRECRLALADVCGDLICSLNKTMKFY